MDDFFGRWIAKLTGIGLRTVFVRQDCLPLPPLEAEVRRVAGVDHLIRVCTPPFVQASSPTAPSPMGKCEGGCRLGSPAVRNRSCLVAEWRPSAPGQGVLHQARGGRTWWAHFRSTRVNIAPTILRNQIEEGMEILDPRVLWKS
jgi:hypothetical protein